MLSVFLVAASLALSATAAVTPLEPAPGLDFPSGGPCTISWSPDTTGTWKTTSIQLMTGPNEPMIHLTTVHTFDGTDASQTSFSWTCPNTTLHSPIYFYQFTSEASFSGAEDPQWTGRFSIGSGPITTPANLDGDVAWDTGALVGFASTPAPPTAPGGSGVVVPPTTTTTTPTASDSQTVPSGTTGGSTTTPSTQPTGGSPHAQPGVGANTRSTRDPTPTPTTTPGDAAVSLRGSAGALVAAAVIAAALL